MATEKLSALPTKSTIDALDYVPIVDVSTSTTKKITQVTLASSLSTTTSGWAPLGFAPTTVTYNGNRSYSAVFNSTDLTGVVSPGMRFRSTRTVPAPTKSTSLNGTSQYYSKSSPAGMTFTDDFVVSAWIKVASYPISTPAGIVSCYNGTSGWVLRLETSGQLMLLGANASSSNFSFVQSYQSVPLNEWVHVSAQLDMSTFTATTTTSYVMIDGVDVPASVSRGGTNPTALIQAGDINIGTANGGTGYNFFPGKIAQVAIYNAKVTQANIAATYSQGLAGIETSLISAYSFNNSITDLNTTTANNLTANGSAVATNADGPFGGQAGGAISSTLDYAEIMDAQFSTDTTLTLRCPQGNTIPTSGGLNLVNYSSVKNPYGWPGISNVLCRLLFMGSTVGAVSTTLQDIPGFVTPTLTIPKSGRELKIRAYLAQTYASVDNSRIDWKIDEDGITVGTVYNRTWSAANGGNGSTILEVSKRVTSGNHTYKLRASTGLGSGTGQTYSDSASPSYFEVFLEDEF